MKLFKVFLTLFIIVIAILGTSRFFPHTYQVTCSITIDKPVDEVYGFMSDLRNWEQWSLWNKDSDSTLTYFYGPTSKGQEARQYLNGKLLGQAQFSFDTCIEEKQLTYHLNMHAGEIRAGGTFLFATLGNQTKLTWLDSGDVGDNPIYRFMLASKTASTRKTFDDGLARIKQVLEQGQ